MGTSFLIVNKSLWKNKDMSTGNISIRNPKNAKNRLMVHLKVNPLRSKFRSTERLAKG